MKLGRYELTSAENFTIFEFISNGPNGKIPKVIQFSSTRYENVFNLAFGDKHPETGELDDFAISNNKDTEKILATVAASVYAFSENHPGAWVYATGSTDARTRLYRIGLTKYLEEAESVFEILGQRYFEWEPFEKGKNYEAFAVKMKNSNLEV